jgi:hypothetical protein
MRKKRIESYINASDLFVFTIHLFVVVSLYNPNNMNKFLVIAILPLLVIILTFKWSDATAVSTGGSATFSQVGTIKRYVFSNVYSRLKFYFFLKYYNAICQA